MALAPEHRALNDYLREVNDARADRVVGAPTEAVLLPPASPTPTDNGFVPPKPWMRSKATGAWCVRYHYQADRPGMRYVYRADTPADLVRFMRDMFSGNPYLDVLKVWEAV